MSWPAVWLIGILVLSVRSPDAWIHPVVYTEDGYWVGYALTQGWGAAFLWAKREYLVWGNILLLWISTRLSYMLSGNPLWYLPETITFVSYGFFSVLATYAWSVSRAWVSSRASWLLFFFLLLLPLGKTANEILGRLSNTGFAFAFLNVLLLFSRKSFSGSKKALVDCLLLLCAATNPVCLLITPLLLLSDALRSQWWKKNAVFLVAFFIVGSGVFVRLQTGQGELVKGSFVPSNLIEVVLARAVLYPFVAPFYSLLNDGVVVVLSVALMGMGVWFYRRTTNVHARGAVGQALVGGLLFLLLTVLLRPSLTQQLSLYQSTFPDRYFMGVNYFVVFIFCLLCGSSKVSEKSAQLGRRCLVGVAVLYGLLLPWLLEIHHPHMRIAKGPLFREQLCLSAKKNSPGETITIPIYFEGWSMEVPRQVLESLVQKHRCSP